MSNDQDLSSSPEWGQYMLGEMLSLKPQCCNNITLLPTHPRPLLLIHHELTVRVHG